MSKSWSEVQNQLDQNISQQDYDKLQLQYFQSNIAPHVRSGYSVQDTWELFRKNNPRPGNTVRAIVNTVGDLALSGAALTALTAVTGPISAPLAETLFGGGKVATAAAKIASVGLANATWDALRASDGDRVHAGIKGAMTGALWEAGVGAVFGFGEKEVAKVAKEAISPPHEFVGPEEFIGPRLPQKEVAEALQTEVEQARKQGYLFGPPVSSASAKGLSVALKDAQGNVVSIPVPRGTDAQVIGQIEEVLQNGGSMDQIVYHPKSQARVSEFLRTFADKAEAETRDFRMKVDPDQAESIAEHLHNQGLKVNVLDEGTIRVGPKAEWVDSAVEAAKTPTVDNLPDEASKKAERLGEIRNRVRLAGVGKGPTVPRGEHTEMHTLAGDLGRDYHLTREQAGQLALKYFLDSRTGEPESAIPLFETFRGSGSKYFEEGGRPPRGFSEEGRLPGFLKPTMSESTVFSMDTPGELRVRPVGRTKVMEGTAEELGFYGAQVRTPEGPTRALSSNATRSDIYHENIHDGLDHAELTEDISRLAGKTHRETLVGLGQGLKRTFPEYGRMSPSQLFNESFTHAAEAVRMGDTAKLEELGRLDTSPDHVKAFVGDTAKAALVDSYKADSAPIRAFQRRLNDLIRRTDPEMADQLDKASLHGWNTWFDPELNKWVMRDGEGREVHHDTIGDVWDRVHESDASDHATDVANPVYFKGAPQKGMIPPGTEPNVGPATAEVDRSKIPHIPFGIASVSNIFEPLMDWASRVQGKLNAHGIDLNFHGAVRDLEDAAHRGDRVTGTDRTQFSTILKGLGGKRGEIGELLSLPQSTWAAHSDAFKLTGDDLARVAELAEWDAQRVRNGQVGIVDTLKKLREVREVGGNLDRIAGNPEVLDAIKRSELGYNKLHVGEIAEWAFRKDYENTIAGPERELFNLKQRFTDNKDITYPVQNYINFVRGIPDSSQKMIDGWSEGIINHINSILPNHLKMDPNTKLWQAFRTISYTSGLGLRPAVAIRDMYQSMFGLVTIGPRAFMEGMARAMTKEGRSEAEAAGALMHGRNAGQFFGDITGNIPQGGNVHEYINRMADTLMAPSRMGHNFGRIITFLGEKGQAARAIEDFRAGKITDPTELARRTSAWFHDAPEQSRLLAMAADHSVPIDKAAEAFALAANEATQFGGSPGTALRTGIGRMLGQYASWPMNHFSFTRKLVSRAVDNPTVGVPAFAMWAAINYGAFKGAESLGIDASKWLFASPAGWTGSPALELAQNLLKAPEESDAGRKARHDVLEFPLQLIPTGVELRNLYDAFDTGDVSPAKILGFKQLKEPEKERDLEDWLYFESGFKPPQ